MATATAENPKPRKPRNVKPKVYRVYLYGGKNANNQHVYVPVCDVADTRDGEKWIGEHGEDGAEYMVACTTFTAKVKTQTETKRILE